MADRGFESLDFYQDSLKLLKAAYRLANRLPDCECYNLSYQLRRAAFSILLNIADGYGRYHYLDRLRFMYIARVPSPQSPIYSSSHVSTSSKSPIGSCIVKPKSSSSCFQCCQSLP